MDLIRARLRQGFKTIAYPDGPANLPARYRGRPVLDPARCAPGCRACADACPTGAVTIAPLALDLGKCLFCPDCTAACPTGALRLSADHRLSASAREDLVLSGDADADASRLARALPEATRRLFRRSLKLRQVSAGGCNGCEGELNAVGGVDFDLSRFGVQFVASPRHADGIVVTGPVSRNMRQALLDTYEAVPSPRLVIAYGTCAIGGGPFAGSPACHDGVPRDLPIDLFVPGCPPHPLTFLDGILRMLGRL